MFETSKEGIIEKHERSFVLHGKERHVPCQEGVMDGYPSRAIRDHKFLYIRNIKPGHWPSGTPDYLNAAISGCWLGDCDNSPTKSYITENKNKDDQHSYYWELSFGKRPSEELYDCINDPGQLNNLANDPSYKKIKESLSLKMTEQLKLSKDPRFTGKGYELEGHPYYGGTPNHPDYKPKTSE